MTAPPIKRKLAAILAADAVGYSRAMAADEEGTMKVLAAHRAVIDGIIQFHEGRIVNTAGDSVIAEFASPTQAVRCAVEIQDALKTRNDSLDEGKRMQFRIGVNLGDVMVKGEDLLGDGVNVAARLESIAEPGGIYVASSVYDQIAGKLDLGFSDLGEQSLKNIDRPVRAYRVDRDKRATPAPAARKQQKRSAMPWVAAGVAALAIGGGATWYAGQQSTARQAEEAKAKAESDAAKARAEAELAKVRAEAEEARKTAAAATDSAARAQAQVELAKARADAESTRRKADAELAAASDARRSAEAAAKSAAAAKPVAVKQGPSYAGPWAGTWSCSGGKEPARTFPAIVTYSGKEFDVQANRPGQPGFRQLIGVPQPDGNLRLTGNALSGSRTSYPASVDGKFTADRYEGRGKFLDRDCVLAFTRGTGQPAAAAAPVVQGAWSGLMTCAPLGSEGVREWSMAVVVNGDQVHARNGKSGQPGWLEMAGVRKTDGTMRLTGAGLSGMKEYLGTSFKADIDGKFAGERYIGKGKLGTRECTFTIARK